MTARPQTSPGLAVTVRPSPHAPAGEGAEAPWGACLCWSAHGTNRPFHRTPLHSLSLHLGCGRPEGKAVHGLRGGWAAGRPRPPPRVPAAGWEHSAVGARPSATSAPSWGHAGFLSCQPASFGNVMPHAERRPARSVRCPVSGRGGGEHPCGPTPSPDRRGLQKGHARALLPDLRRARLSGSRACCTRCEGVKQDGLDSP